MKIELTKVYYEEKDNIGYIVINEPPANKMTSLFLKEFTYLVHEHITQSKVKGIIITGKGRHFCSGADVDQLQEMVATNCIMSSEGDLTAYPVWYVDNRMAFDYFSQLNIPVISAINGFCIGSGFELALCSHIRICGNGAFVGLPESTFGIMPGVTGTLRYLELIGLGKSLELILNGDTFYAEEALKIGVIDGIVNKKETLTYCEKLIRFILEDDKPYSKVNVTEYIKRFNEIYYKNIE